PFQIRNPKPEGRIQRSSSYRFKSFSDFGVLSGFGLRPSYFKAVCLPFSFAPQGKVVGSASWIVLAETAHEDQQRLPPCALHAGWFRRRDDRRRPAGFAEDVHNGFS